MQSKTAFIEEKAVVNTLSELIKTYEEVYMLKMYRTRNSVLNTREYYKRIFNLYIDIKSSYKNEILKSIHKVNKDSVFSVLDKPKEHVSVFISGNDRFAGDINNKVFKDFLEYFRQNKPDLVVIGQIGKSLMQQRARTINYQYFDLAEDFGVSNSKELKPIVDYLILYKDVRVFYGEFENMISQVPINNSITGEIGEILENADTNDDKEVKNLKKQEYYLFEPSLINILTFFETQIFTSLFKRAIEESTLAQIGARVASLEQSTSEIDKKIKQLNYMSLKNNKNIKNKKQQNILVGINFLKNQNAW